MVYDLWFHYCIVFFVCLPLIVQSLSVSFSREEGTSGFNYGIVVYGSARATKIRILYSKQLPYATCFLFKALLSYGWLVWRGLLLVLGEFQLKGPRVAPIFFLGARAPQSSRGLGTSPTPTLKYKSASLACPSSPPYFFYYFVLYCSSIKFL